MKLPFLEALLCLPLFLGTPVSGSPFPEKKGLKRFSAERLAVSVPQNTTGIENGQIWYDTDGGQISAYGGGVLNVDGTFYWVGQAMSNDIAGLEPSEDKVHLYMSEDLMTWTKVGAVLTVYTPDEDGNQLLTYCNLERPKIIYNPVTEKFVLWAHWEEKATYSASQAITATADQIEGPWTITSKGHRRPGTGNTDDSAMGDRVGSPVIDYATAAPTNAPSTVNGTEHPYSLVHEDYPPKILQFNEVDASDPQKISYVSQSDGYGSAQVDNWWTYQLTEVDFNMTLKAVAVKMTDFDTSAYDKYKDSFDVTSEYIVRYATDTRSPVAKSVFTIGDSGTERTELVAPVIGPGLEESSSSSVVYVNSGDAAFITVTTNNATIYYTTDGSDPTESSDRFWDGTRITMSGSSGNQTTIKAISVAHGETSEVSSQTYEIASDPSSVPVFTPIINYPSGTYSRDASAFGYMAMRVYCPSFNTECYYTMDGLDPDPPVKGDNIGYRCRDITVFQDPKTFDAYLVCASDNNFGRIWLLNEDYTDVVPDMEYDVFSGESREAPALVRNGEKDGQYVYLVTSTQSGYYPNQAQYKRIQDPYDGFSLDRDETTGYRDGSSVWSHLQPLGDSTTYWSQPTWILNIGTDSDPVYLYLGDRYNTITLAQSTNVWMPLTIDDDGVAATGDEGSGLMELEYRPELVLDVAHHKVVDPDWKLLSLNKSVEATPAKVPATDSPTVDYAPSAANDGVNFDIDPYDSVQQYYCPSAVPFFWRVDLGDSHDLSWIGLSFMSVGGSDAVTRYTVSGSNDKKAFKVLHDNTNNLQPGFQSHALDGSYRYIQIDVISVWDVAHNTEADWEAAAYEISVYGS